MLDGQSGAEIFHSQQFGLSQTPTIEDETSHCFREGQPKFRTEIRISLVFKIDHFKKKVKVKLLSHVLLFATHGL